MRVTAVLALCASSTGVLFAQQTGADWKEYLGGPDSSHYSPLNENVSLAKTFLDSRTAAGGFPRRNVTRSNGFVSGKGRSRYNRRRSAY
jgi:hypothetical protein